MRQSGVLVELNATTASDRVTTLWHNPNCSKSRGAVDWMSARLDTFVVRDFIQTPPSAAELRCLLSCEGLQLHHLVRDATALEQCAIAQAATLHARIDVISAILLRAPSRLQRPIVSDGRRALIARPIELAEIFLASDQITQLEHSA